MDHTLLHLRDVLDASFDLARQWALSNELRRHLRTVDDRCLEPIAEGAEEVPNQFGFEDIDPETSSRLDCLLAQLCNEPPSSDAEGVRFYWEKHPIEDGVWMLCDAESERKRREDFCCIDVEDTNLADVNFDIVRAWRETFKTRNTGNVHLGTDSARRSSMSESDMPPLMEVSDSESDVSEDEGDLALGDGMSDGPDDGYAEDYNPDEEWPLLDSDNDPLEM